MTKILQMTELLLDIVIVISIIAISFSLLFLLYRVIVGPSNADRAVALDALGINLMGLAAIMAITLVTTKLNDVILLIGSLLFIGTIAIAKYIEKGDIIGRDLE